MSNFRRRVIVTNETTNPIPVAIDGTLNEVRSDTTLVDTQIDFEHKLNGDVLGYELVTVGGRGFNVGAVDRTLSPVNTNEIFLLIPNTLGEACSATLSGAAAPDVTVDFWVWRTIASTTAELVTLNLNSVTPVSLGSIYRIEDIRLNPLSPNKTFAGSLYVGRDADGFDGVTGEPLAQYVDYLDMSKNLRETLIYFQPLGTIGAVDSIVLTSDMDTQDSFQLNLMTVTPTGVEYSRIIYFTQGIQNIGMTNRAIPGGTTVHAKARRVDGAGSADLTCLLNITRFTP